MTLEEKKKTAAQATVEPPATVSPATNEQKPQTVTPTQPQTVAPSTTAPATNTGAGVATGAPTYTDPYAAEIKAQYDAIINRKPFSYNAAEDPMYQQYVDKYVQGGKLAMRDSMGQAAALTGGYGSSYGQAVGQQQYNEYMRSLADVLPELYGQAYTQYRDEGDRMLQSYQMLNEQSDDAYAKYRDAYSDYIYNEQMAYDRQQDAYKNLQSIIAATGMIPTADQLSESGMTEAEARALRMEYAKADPKAAVRKGIITAEEYKQITGKKYGSSSGGGGGSSSGKKVEPPTTIGFVDVAGVVGQMNNDNADKKDIGNYLAGAVDSGSITKKEADYIKKDLKVKDRM